MRLRLQRSRTRAQPGDTVYLSGGIYSGWNQTVHPARSGTADAWITFAALSGELPIFDTGGLGSGDYEYIRYVGLASRNNASSGFGNGWTNGDCNPVSNSNIQYVNCIADNNGINGIAHYCATGLLIKQSIIAHNGNEMPSWSSGVNLFGVQGSPESNVVEQTLSFENTDISDHRSDGSGFIVDQNSTGATFRNNIGFRNGGSCIRITNSPNVQIINNTCVNNGVEPNLQYHDEIFFSDSSSRSGALLLNNLTIPTSEQRGLAMGDGVPDQNNLWDGTGTIMSATGVLDFHLVEGSSPIDAGGASAPVEDIGFDWACIKQESGQSVSWWSYAIDYDYIVSVGGIAACFQPGKRDGSPDIGAYEFGASVSPGAGGTLGTGGTASTGETTPAGGGTASTGETTPAGGGTASTGETTPAANGTPSTGETAPATDGTPSTTNTQAAGGTPSTTRMDPSAPTPAADTAAPNDEGSGCASAAASRSPRHLWIGIGLALALLARLRRRFAHLETRG